jgi:hypothetical protein
MLLEGRFIRVRRDLDRGQPFGALARAVNLLLADACSLITAQLWALNVGAEM